MKMKKMTTGLVATACAAALVLGSALPAMAATRNGQKECSGTRTPVLSLNTSGGSGSWTNFANPSAITPFSFTSGTQTRSATYQSTYWNVTSNNFFAEPSANCV